MMKLHVIYRPWIHSLKQNFDETDLVDDVEMLENLSNIIIMTLKLVWTHILCGTTVDMDALFPTPTFTSDKR